MTNKKSHDSHKDFTAFNLTFNQREFANNIKSHWCKELEDGTEEKFKRSKVGGGGNDTK